MATMIAAMASIYPTIKVQESTLESVPAKRPVAVNRNSNIPMNANMRSVLEMAIEALKGATGIQIPMPEGRNVATKYVDDVLVDLVQMLNRQSDQHKVTLYNGITGRRLAGPMGTINGKIRNHIFIRLGHMLVPLTDATLPKQMGVTADIGNKIMNMTRRNVFTSGEAAAVREVARLDATVKKKVRDTKSPITVIAYPSANRIRYSLRDPSKQMLQEKRYLYLGIRPEEFRKPGQTYCFVFSKFSPTIFQDKLSMQRESGARLDPTEPIQARVLKSAAPKFQWKTPRVVKNASAEDVGVVAAGVGLGTLGLSSMIMIL